MNYTIVDGSDSMKTEEIARLLKMTYWADKRPPETIEKSVRNSSCYGIRPENGGQAKPASRETYFSRVANNALSDFISIVNADKRGFRYAHSYFTSKPDEEVGDNEVKEEDIAEERRNTVRDMIFRIDVEELRRRLAPEVRRAFDLMLDGHAHYQISNLLGVSTDKYRLRYLSPIQKVAIEIGFIPNDFRGMVDKMYVFKYKIRESIRAHKGESGR